MHHYRGAKVTMLENGNIEITPGPSGKVLVADAGGTPVELALKSDVQAIDAKYNGHIVVWAHDGNATSTMQVYAYDESGAPAALVSSSIGMGAGGLAPVVIPITTPITDAGLRYMLRVQAGTTDITMSKGETTCDAP